MVRHKDKTYYISGYHMYEAVNGAPDADDPRVPENSETLIDIVMAAMETGLRPDELIALLSDRERTYQI